MPTNTYYIDVAVGNDVNLGTSEGVGNAWASIGHAMDTVAADDLVYVKASGDYIAQDGATGAIGQIDTAGGAATPIVFEGYTTTPGDGTFACVTLDAGTNALANCINSNLGSVALYYTFRNFRFTGGSSHGVDLTDEDNVFFSRCRFDNNGSNGILGDNLYVFSLCQADNNSLSGMELGIAGYYCSLVSFSNTSFGLNQTGTVGVLYNCILYENRRDQVSFGGEAFILNSTIDGNNSTELGIDGIRALSIVANTILYDCSTGIDGNPGSEDLCVSLHNLFHSNTADVANWPTDPSDIIADPLFVNAAANDYRLSDASPARQAGIDAGEVVNGASYVDVGAQQSIAFHRITINNNTFGL